MNSFEFDPKRRHMLLGALATVGGTILPWEFAAAAQAAGGTSALNIAYITDVPTWDPAR